MPNEVMTSSKLTGVEVRAEFLGELIDDKGAVGDLFSVELDKRQLALLGTKLGVMFHILWT